MSDRAPSCPFCGATLPAATVDRDATPARGLSATTALPIPPPPPASSPASETTSLGPFDRVRPLDASGRTWLGFAPEGGGRAAVVKALDGADGPAAALWSALQQHTSVVRAFGLLAGEERPRVVFEYVAPDAHSRKVQGRSAFERRLRRERLAFPDVLRLGVLVCRGLEHVYAGGLRGHGNLKPSNLLLGLDGGLRVSEAGLAGTSSPLELAPERFDGAPADERSDVYSLGVLLFQMAGGRPPFDAPAGGAGGDARHREALRHLHKDALVPRLDSPLAALLERCLQKAPEARFPAVAALRTELEDLLRRETGLLPPLPPPGEAAGWERAQQALALLAVGRAEPAVRAFDQALLALPPVASVRAVRATALNVLGQHEEAVREAEAAIAIDPQHAPAWRQKGESLAALGRREEALDALEQTAVIAPRDAASLVALGRLLGAVGRLPQALSAYDRAVAADAEHVDVWLERGSTLAAAGLRADAAGAFLRFLDVSPTGHPARARAEEMLREVRGVAPPLPTAPAPVPAAAPPPVREESAPPEVSLAPEPPAQSVLPEAAPTLVPPEEEEPEPADVAGKNERGVALFREGRLDQALGVFDRALAKDPRRAATLSNRANVLFRLGRAEEGLADQERALAREPRSAGSWLSKATIERALGRAAQARRSLLDLLSLQPPPEPRLLDQARSLLAEIERQGVPPGQATPLSFLLAGLQHAEAGRLPEAVADFDEALGRDALLPAAWLFKGEALLTLGRVAEAARAFDEGLAADPAEVRLLMGLGRARARLGDLDVATAVLTRALELAEGDSRTQVERLLKAVATRRTAVPVAVPEAAPTPVPVPEAALTPLPVPETAPEPAPDDPLEPHPAPPTVQDEPVAAPLPVESAALWATKGMAALEAGHIEDAVSAFDEALQLSPRLRDAWIGRGLAQKKLGRFDDAISSFVKVLQTDPADVEALYQKAGSEEQAGRPAEAARTYEQFMEAAPDDSRGPLARAQHAKLLQGLQPPPTPPPPSLPPPPPIDPVAAAAALAAQGRHAEALEALDRAFATGTDDGPFWITRGDSLRALGRKEEAAAAFDQAIKRAPRDPLAWIKKGDALDAAGLFTDAVVCYDQAVELHPRHLGAWNSKGVCLTRLDRIDDALYCFTRALELDPRFALARFNKGAAEDRLGRGEEALRSYQAFLSLAPPTLRAQIQYAQKRMQALKAPRA